MNYRHIYHAGNFADIFKHCALTLILSYMQRKPAAFRLIDTHAGPGFYDLRSEAAAKTAEWQSGLIRFLAALRAGPDAAAAEAADYGQIAAEYQAICAAGAANLPLLAPYLAALAAAQNSGPAGRIPPAAAEAADSAAAAAETESADNAAGSNAAAEAPPLRYYPGSPWLARYMLRRQDRLTAIELHEREYAKLRQRFSGDFQSRILHLDGRLALKAQLPPKEKRGLILVDPPFEAADEFAALAEGLNQALRRFPQGSYMIWYPVKDYRAVSRFAESAAEAAAAHAAGAVLQAELRIRRPSPVSAPRLDGSGLLLINPPYLLAEQLKQLEPLFLRAFAEDKGAALKLDWLRRN